MATNTGDPNGTTTTTSRSPAIVTTSTRPIYAPSNRPDAFNAIVDINRRDSSGYTALHRAAILGSFNEAQTLLEAGADKDASTNEGYTAIMLAASNKQPGMVKHLACYGIGVTGTIKHTTNEHGVVRPITPSAYEEMANSLRGVTDEKYWDTFMQAVGQSDIVMAAHMLATRKISLSKRNKRGDTPLVLAAKGGEDEMIRLLLCNGAATNETDNRGKSPLMHAVFNQKLPAIRALMNAGANPTQADEYNNTALKWAVYNDDSKGLDTLLSCMNGSGKLHKLGPRILRRAAKNGKTKTVEMLLARKTDLPDAKGSLALATMVEANHLRAVKTLLEAGADPHHQDWDGHTAFTLAAANGLIDIVNALFDHRPKSLSEEKWIQTLQKETDNEGRTALMLAVLNQQSDMTYLLMSKKADILKKDRRGRNAMLWAAARGGASIASMLNTYPAAPFVLDDDENNVFLAAAAGGRKDVLQTFILSIGANSPININSPNKDGDTPLIVAARHGHLEIVQLLLGNHADFVHRNKMGRSALLESVSHGHMKIRDLLYAKLAERDRELQEVNSVMHAVIKAVNDIFPATRNIFKELPALKISQTDNDGNSELHMLARGGHDLPLDQLLAARTMPMGDADGSTEAMSDNDNVVTPGQARSVPTVLGAENLNIEILNSEGLTPLCEAVRYGQYRTVQVFLEQGAKVNHASRTGVTPLWLACRARVVAVHPGMPVNTGASGSRPIDMVELLLGYGALPDAPSFDKQTPLMAASLIGDSAVVIRLLRAGANINHANQHGLTPLMFASHFGHVEVATILLNNGAVPNPDPGNNVSALLLAAESGRDKNVKLLLERGANPNYQHEDGSTALTAASAAGNVSTVTLLVRSGAERSIQDKFRKNAMDYAMAKGHHAVIQVLKKGYRPPRDN
jgi:ankyrin repeat protein